MFKESAVIMPALIVAADVMSHAERGKRGFWARLPSRHSRGRNGALGYLLRSHVIGQITGPATQPIVRWTPFGRERVDHARVFRSGSAFPLASQPFG